MIPNLIFCNKETVVPGSEDSLPVIKNKFAPGRLVAGLLTAGLGVFVGFLPTSGFKKRKKDDELGSAVGAITRQS